MNDLSAQDPAAQDAAARDAAAPDPAAPDAAPGGTRGAVAGRYRVTVERDEGGVWFADFPDVPGCHTQGRTLRQARGRMRDALSLYADDADVARLDEEVYLPGALADAAAGAARARDVAAAAQQRALEATDAALRALTGGGLSRADADELLGLSHRRVHQVLAGSTASPDGPGADADRRSGGGVTPPGDGRGDGRGDRRVRFHAGNTSPDRVGAHPPRPAPLDEEGSRW